MDVQFWIYIIIGVIYFLSRVLKKTEQPGGESPDSRPERKRPRPSETTSTEMPRQMTFEELLREITEGKKAQKPAPQPAPVRRFERVENEVDDEARSLEEIPDEAENARVFKSYEDAKRQVSRYASLEETLKLQDTSMDFGKFKVFEAQNRKSLLGSYVNIIRNPESLKQAIVMSEILKRKF